MFFAKSTTQITTFVFAFFISTVVGLGGTITTTCNCDPLVHNQVNCQIRFSSFLVQAYSFPCGGGDAAEFWICKDHSRVSFSDPGSRCINPLEVGSTGKLYINDFVKLFPGDINILFSAPHGSKDDGTPDASAIPFNCGAKEGILYENGPWEKRINILGHRLQSYFEENTGKHPWFLKSEINRKRVDFNRDSDHMDNFKRHVTCGDDSNIDSDLCLILCSTSSMDEDALAIWKGFHGFIAAFASLGSESSPNFGGLGAMIFDIHGCATCGVDIGYGITQGNLETLAEEYANGRPYDFDDPQVTHPERVHIPNLLNKLDGNLDALFGPDALGTILDRNIGNGYIVTPSSDSKYESESGYFAGSTGICRFYTLDEEVDRSELKTDCLQIESNTTLRSSMNEVEDYAHDLADAIQLWFEKNWDVDWTATA